MVKDQKINTKYRMDSRLHHAFRFRYSCHSLRLTFKAVSVLPLKSFNCRLLIIFVYIIEPFSRIFKLIWM